MACRQCGGNCEKCKDQTGECEQCASEHVLNADGLSCAREATGDCPFPYGPVDGEQQCKSARYSDDRLIEPFKENDVSVDWRLKGVVNPVRDQSTCGSCWAFMSVFSLETWYAIKYGPLYKLSEQFLVSCDSGNYGCGGGWPTDAYNFVRLEGSVLLKNYPYTNNAAACYAAGLDRLVYTDSSRAFVDVRGSNQEAFKAALRLGPVGVAFSASNTFMYHGAGIYDGDCDPAGVNHGMVAIGYGTENGYGYAIVRNSWGTTWGEQGYVRVRMEANEGGSGKCELYAYPNYPVIA